MDINSIMGDNEAQTVNITLTYGTVVLPGNKVLREVTWVILISNITAIALTNVKCVRLNAVLTLNSFSNMFGE